MTTSSVVPESQNILNTKQYVKEAWSSPFDPATLSNSSLHELVLHLFNPCSISIGISTDKMSSFLRLVQGKYHNNPYHCWAHAVHVTFNAYRLSKELRDSSSFDHLDQFVLLFSAVIHDLHHPGHSNMFEIQSNSELARLYNDQSVIENHSLSVGFDLVKEAELFLELSTEIQNSIRARTVEMVLATDISPPSGKDRALLMSVKWAAAFGDDVTPEEFKVETAEQRQRVHILLLRIADLGSAMQPFSVFGNWSQRLYVENNRASGLTQECHTNTQKPFMEYLCVPLVTEASKYPILKNIHVLKELLEGNLKRWNSLDVQGKCAAITAAYVVQPEGSSCLDTSATTNGVEKGATSKT